MDEKFICTYDDFNEKPENDIRGALYESENFKVTLSYDGSYFKDKENKFVIEPKHSIHFVIKPKIPNSCITVSYSGHTSPYDGSSFFSWGDCPKLPKQIDSGNYERIMNAYKEAFARAIEAAEEIFPKYFPKDAEFI